MLAPPKLHPSYMYFTAEITRVLATPFMLTGALAGSLAFRLQTEPLVVSIARMRPEPNPAVTTLTESFCAHCLLPSQNQEEYNKRPHADRPFTPKSERIGLHHLTAKKEEDDPFGSGSEERKRIFQIG